MVAAAALGLAPRTVLDAQTRTDSLAVLQEIERVIAAPRAKPGAEGRLLVVGVSGSLGAIGALVSETLGRICVEGARAEPEPLVGSVDVTDFQVGSDTAVVRLRTTDGSGTAGTDDTWRLIRDPLGHWQGVRVGGGSWTGVAGPTRPPARASFCRGRE